MRTDYALLIEQQKKYIEKVFRRNKLRIPLLALSPKMRKTFRKYTVHTSCSDEEDEFNYLSQVVDEIDRNAMFRFLNRVLHRIEDFVFEKKYKNQFYFVKKKLRREKEIYLSIVCIIKNEARYIREWIAYYKIMGVDHIFLFNNDSTDNVESTINGDVQSGYVTLINFPGANAQLPAYRLAAKALKGVCRWVAFIDADEFVIPIEGNLKEYLVKREQFPAIGINWVVYGTGGHVERPEGLVAENYLYTFEDKNNLLNLRIKSIANPKEIYDISSPHYCILKHGKYAVDEDDEEITSKWMYVSGSGAAFTGENKTQKVRINHYWTKSEQDLREKCNRGYAAGGFNPDYENIMKRLDYPQKEDRAIIPYVDKIKDMLNKSDKIGTY